MPKQKVTLEQKLGTQNSTRHDAAFAVGSVLGFYRRLDGRSQVALANDAALHPSEVALYESGQRLPSQATLDKIAEQLSLDAFQARQLKLVAGYPNRAEAAGHEWIMPEDILRGLPIFLRRLEREAELQREADISEMWVVAMRPLALEGVIYEILKTRLLHDKTKFVYFVGSEAGEQMFQTLWRRLYTDSPKRAAKTLGKLECILSPEILFLNHFTIANPGQQSRMFGRAIMYQNTLPVGFYPMDPVFVDRASNILQSVYRECVRNVGKDVKLKFGTFRMVRPRI